MMLNMHAARETVQDVFHQGLLCRSSKGQNILWYSENILSISRREPFLSFIPAF